MRRTWMMCWLVAAACVGDATDKLDDGDDDGVSDTDGSDTDDSGVGDCWELATLLDVGAAPGPGAGYPDPELSGACDGDTFTVQSNAIPHYTYVAMTPNALVEADQLGDPSEPCRGDEPQRHPVAGSDRIHGVRSADLRTQRGRVPRPLRRSTTESPTGARDTRRLNTTITRCLRSASRRKGWWRSRGPCQTPPETSPQGCWLGPWTASRSTARSAAVTPTAWR